MEIGTDYFAQLPRLECSYARKDRASTPLRCIKSEVTRLPPTGNESGRYFLVILIILRRFPPGIGPVLMGLNGSGY